MAKKYLFYFRYLEVFIIGPFRKKVAGSFGPLGLGYRICSLDWGFDFSELHVTPKRAAMCL